MYKRQGLDIVAPVETKQIGKKPINLWTTAGTRVSLKKSNQLYKKYKKNPTAEKKSEYKKYKKKLDKLLRILKSDYYDVIIQDAGTDSRKIWSILNELIDRKQCRHKMPNRFIIDGKSVRNKRNIATAFNVYFSSIGSEMAEKIPDTQGYETYLKSRSTWQIFNLEELCKVL